MTSGVKSLAQINHEAISILCRHLGVADTLRLISQFTNGDVITPKSAARCLPT